MEDDGIIADDYRAINGGTGPIVHIKKFEQSWNWVDRTGAAIINRFVGDKHLDLEGHLPSQAKPCQAMSSQDVPMHHQSKQLEHSIWYFQYF